jgi:hypothetical protein
VIYSYVIEEGDLHMRRSKFTSREQQILRKNQYTYRVTDSQIFFTKEFKEEFWRQYQLGSTPREIATSLGYDPDILGTSRLTGLQINIKKQAIRPKGFTEGKGRRKCMQSELDSIDEKPSDKTIIKMQHELLYLKQEMEFLKKISSIRNMDK